MSIPLRLTQYLDQQGVDYDIWSHRPSRTSAETARLAHVQPAQLAKPVLLEDNDGYLMAVIPSDRRVEVGRLAQLLQRKGLRLSDERWIATRFTDCDPGTAPSLGMPWGVETVVDETLESPSTVFLECGDHECLLQMTHNEFHRLMRSQRHGRFSRPQAA